MSSHSHRTESSAMVSSPRVAGSDVVSELIVVCAEMGSKSDHHSRLHRHRRVGIEEGGLTSGIVSESVSDVFGESFVFHICVLDRIEVTFGLRGRHGNWLGSRVSIHRLCRRALGHGGRWTFLLVKEKGLVALLVEVLVGLLQTGCNLGKFVG